MFFQVSNCHYVCIYNFNLSLFTNYRVLFVNCIILFSIFIQTLIVYSNCYCLINFYQFTYFDQKFFFLVCLFKNTSALQVNVTPKEKKTESSRVDVKPIKDFHITLAPFQPQTRISLETPVNSQTECFLHVKNTGNRSLNVSTRNFLFKTKSLVELLKTFF